MLQHHGVVKERKSTFDKSTATESITVKAYGKYLQLTGIDIDMTAAFS